MSTSTTTLIALVLAACSAFGCSSSFAAATPPAFVELDGQKTYDYRATSADGVVLSVRAIDNEPKGTLSFWSEVVERKLRLGEGYALLEKRDVAARRGEHGTQLRFGRDQGGVPHLYSVTVFVTDKRIFVLEAGGTKVDMERYADSIDWSVRNFAIRLAKVFTKTPRRAPTAHRLAVRMAATAAIAPETSSRATGVVTHAGTSEGGPSSTAANPARRA